MSMTIPMYITSSVEQWDQRVERHSEALCTACQKVDLVWFKEQIFEDGLDLGWSDRDTFIYLLGRYDERRRTK